MTHLRVDLSHYARWPSRRTDDVVELALELAFDVSARREGAEGGEPNRAVLLDFQSATAPDASARQEEPEPLHDNLAATLAAFLHLTRGVEVKTAVVVPVGQHTPRLGLLLRSTPTLAVFEERGAALAWLAS